MISNAVILMAGSGSRFGGVLAKPLVRVLDRPLISYTFEALAMAGIETVHAVVGFEAERLIASIEPLVPSGLRLHFIANPEWRKQNGVSVLAAAKHVTSPFLLTMSDHLFGRKIIDLLIDRAVPGELNLAIDRKINSIFDLADATKVRTSDGLIIDIGKELEDYDAVDTGLFVCPSAIFEYLERAKQNGDCSLSDGVCAMARDARARAVDIGEAWWQDIDTPEALLHAEKQLAANASRSRESEAAKK